MRKRVLLLDGYDAFSHKVWRQGLQRVFQQVEWTCLALPPRFFSWRIRGSALSFYSHYRQVIEQEYDLLICTSMVDMAALKGLFPSLARTPSLLYFHENQFVYPESEQHDIKILEKQQLDAQMVTIYSAFAADLIAFNSRYNFETFIKGGEALFKKLPDFVPLNWRDEIELKSRILPVPIEEPTTKKSTGATSSSLDQITLVWNHRWEYDKGPDRLLYALREMRKRSIPFSLHLLGQQFRQWPTVFDTIHAEFKPHLITFGYEKNRAVYLKLLQSSNIVLSTAIHEFEGLAILEAVANGCVPLVPDRLSYVEMFNSSYRYESCLASPELEAISLVDTIEDWLGGGLDSLSQLVPAVASFTWSELEANYRQVFYELSLW